MNYRHTYHAGNFADVAKHLALVGVLLHLKKKDTPFAVIDTHAGRGLYDLSGSEAERTGEAKAGIARLRDLRIEDAPPLLAAYLEVARGWGETRYPGSPLIAARLLRPQDRLVAIEKHPDEFAALKRALQPYPRARAVGGDGYEQLPALLPPPERRGVVLIDPPYESENDFADAARAAATAIRKFATAILLIWFPVKAKAEADRFCGEVIAAGAGKALRVDIVVDNPPRDGKARLSSAGLLVMNPPYGFDTEMTRALDAIAPLLGSNGEVVRLTAT
ncbi:MAG TPA: 23S rRNA (adenine(2030)-N(6))-methyltransferase RlmJ [Rhizomicrobium sp.]|jgi:23S rRNA (adenine2030-N6)-methyltransferase